MAENVRNFQKDIPTTGMGVEIDTLINYCSSQRKNFEKRAYDNNFFDDGFHFRYVSRTTGKIVDMSEAGVSTLPERAIPKASRQIRGVTNLLLQPDYTPVVYPEKVAIANFPPIPGPPDPMTGQPTMQMNPDYVEAMKESKTTAQRVGHWINEEWNTQHLKEKLMLMVMLAAKHGVSYLQIWPDAIGEKIKTGVFDFFDIYLIGSLNSIYDSPFIIKTTPRLLAEIIADENFDPGQTAKLTPDNKYASSEVKEAYMRSRHGPGLGSDVASTVIQKEMFRKEYLSEKNFEQVSRMSRDANILKDKKMGDMVMRHTFSAGGVWLLDEYIDLPEYPFVDFRFEPGAIYQTPLIERFIPANKSLDIIISRLERWANTMVVGAWLTRKGENFEITNVAGGQKLEYTSTPPVQAQMANIPQSFFGLIDFLEKTIEEQGASTSALGQLPPGVKSGVAIESLKATEYANLKIATNQLKETVKLISEKMLDIAANYFVNPQTVYLLESGEPDYFEIIGQKGVEVRQENGIEVPNAVPIKKDYRVNIEVESGLGFTVEGKKETAQQIAAFTAELAKGGLISPEVLNIVIKKLFELYQFGSTQELMDALNEPPIQQGMSEDQLAQIKIAVVEVLKDLSGGGPQPQPQSAPSGEVQ